MPHGHKLAGSGPVPLAALDGAAVVCPATECGMARLLDQARDEHGARPATRHQADTAARVAGLVRAGLGVAATTERAAPPAALHRQPVACRAAHDVVLVAVAGRPFTRAADAFIKLARARGWQPATQPSVTLWFEARQRRLRGGGLHRLDHGQADGVLQEAAVPGYAGASQDDRLGAAIP